MDVVEEREALWREALGYVYFRNGASVVMDLVVFCVLGQYMFMCASIVIADLVVCVCVCVAAALDSLDVAAACLGACRAADCERRG